MSYADRTDRNQTEVVKRLRDDGADVFYLKLPADLLVAKHGFFIVVEVKRHWTRGQNRKDFHMTEPERQYYRKVCRKAPYCVVDSPGQAGSLLLHTIGGDTERLMQFCIDTTRAWAELVRDPIIASIPKSVAELDLAYDPNKNSDRCSLEAAGHETKRRERTGQLPLDAF